MADKQPEALRIADALDASEGNFYAESSLWYDKALSMTVDDAAAELRRLHALIAELVEAADAYLEAQGAVDNRELMGPNAPLHEELFRMLKRAYTDFEVAIAKAKES